MNQQIKKMQEMIAEFKASIPFICELKLTEKCNLRCEYCYRESHSGSDINPMMVVSFFDELATYYAGKLVCSFHGGEPLMAYNVLKSIVKSLKEKPYFDRMMFSIQTNGTCLTDEIIDYLKSERIGVGISVDANNDASRVYPGGKGPFNIIEKNIMLLRKRDIDVSTTCVVTSKNLDRLKDYFFWCHRIGIKSVSFNYVRISKEKDMHLGLVPDVIKYANLMKEIFDLQIEINQSCKEKIYVLEFSNLINKITNPYFECYVCNAPCKAGIRIVCLNVDGLVERCDCLVNNIDNRIGYYHKNNLSKLLDYAKSTYKPIVHEDYEACIKCEIEKFCTYGCKAENEIFGDRIMNNPGKMCEYYKILIPYIIYRLDQGISPDLFMID